MSKRPLAVIIIGFVFIATGVLALAYHLSQYHGHHPFQFDIVEIAIVEILAIVAGAFLLRGSNWARWLAIAWIGAHVILSVFHPLRELAVHGLLFVIITYFLVRPEANRFFRSARTETP
jgi:hypothetical protein